MYELSAEFIQKLKKSNVSKDAEKTKSRFQGLWKDASKAQKAKVLEDAGIVRATVYRIYNTGAISSKIVMAASQAFNVSPFFITGEADEPGEFSMDAAKAFLVGRGYEKLVNAQLSDMPAKSRRIRNQRQSQASYPETDLDESSNISDEPLGAIPEEAPAVLSLDEDEIIALLRALTIRARVSHAAKKILDGVVSSLIS